MSNLAPGVALAVLLMLFTGVTHLLRPGVWRETIRVWAGQRVPGVTLYGVLHALPGGLLVALSLNDLTFAGRVALGYGLVLAVKGTGLVLLPDRAHGYLERCCERSLAAWRAPGVVGLLLAVGLAGLGWSGA